jgi:hypothetical protein
VILCKWIGDGRTEAVQSIRYSDCVGCLSLLCRAILGSFVALISSKQNPSPLSVLGVSVMTAVRYLRESLNLQRDFGIYYLFVMFLSKGVNGAWVELS